MAARPPGPLGTDTNPGHIDFGTTARTEHLPPGQVCVTRPSPTQAAHQLRTSLADLRASTNWLSTRHSLVGLFGFQSFSIGVAVGVGENLIGSAVDLVKFIKMCAFAEYYESRMKPHSFGERVQHSVLKVFLDATGFSLMSTAASLTGHGSDFDHEAQKDYEALQALTQALIKLFEHPGEIFGALGQSIQEAASAKYHAFKDYLNRGTLAGNFQAGKLLGGLLLDLAALVSLAGGLAKLARIPRLIEFMTKELERVLLAIQRARAGAGASGAGDAAKTVAGKQYDLLNLPKTSLEPTEASVELPKPDYTSGHDIGPQLPKWGGRTDYSHIPDPAEVVKKTKPTPRQVREMKAANRANNGGILRDDVTGELMVDSAKSTKGVTPPSNEAQVDHIKPVDAGGTREQSNLELRTRKNNREKSNSWNDDGNDSKSGSDEQNAEQSDGSVNTGKNEDSQTDGADKDGSE